MFTNCLFHSSDLPGSWYDESLLLNPGKLGYYVMKLQILFEFFASADLL